MRHIVAIACLCALIVVSGGRKKQAPGDSIIGSWELRQSMSGMLPVRNYPPGNGNILKFTSDSYQLYANGQLVKSGTYGLQYDSTAEANVCLVIQPGEFLDRIIYDNNTTAWKEFLQLSGNNLTFIKGCFALDAGVKNVYERL